MEEESREADKEKRVFLVFYFRCLKVKPESWLFVPTRKQNVTAHTRLRRQWSNNYSFRLRQRMKQFLRNLDFFKKSL